MNKQVSSGIFICCLFLLLACDREAGYYRNVVSLNGTWNIAESADQNLPQQFGHTISVPGLVDLANPAFDSVGLPSEKRLYFWYNRKVEVPATPSEKVLLKIHKAKFGQKVYVNGKEAGEYHYNFTPGLHDITEHIEFGATNDITIRVGASPAALPDTIPYGEDVEKAIYYPGLYDRVELIYTGYPFIDDIQVVPDIENESVKAVIQLSNGSESSEFAVNYVVKESASGKKVATGSESVIEPGPEEKITVELTIPITDARLWSPEDPFLYEITVATSGDSRTEKFGMREFRFDPETKKAMLNDRPYYLRGTNIALHRFFEDSARGLLPWDEQWIRAFHDTLKSMNWNSYRFHVGFAPEIWYEIADEKGFLVQDEYAIWGIFSDDTTRHMASTLIPEYENWILERKNHPSVVVWDAQNETVWKETAKVIESVRSMDLSDRPWDNGFSPPGRESDMIESHPYLFSKVTEMPSEGLLKAKLGAEPEPFGDPNSRWVKEGEEKFDNPVIVNEYGWIWLYRDGSPASVAEKIWKLYPEYESPEERWDWRGRVIAAQTEYWRSQRTIAGVQHFCILTANRPHFSPRSQVSDEWKDVENLILHPGFKKHVKSAFSPVGVMIKMWDWKLTPFAEKVIPVSLVNDLYEDWEGELQLVLLNDGQQVTELSKMVQVPSLGKQEIEFEITLPDEKGAYELVAIIHRNGEEVRSSRLFTIE